MYQINEDKSIYVTRGDILSFSVTADDDGEEYTFQTGDIVRLTIYAKKNCENVLLCKDFAITEETKTVSIFLEEKDTKFGDVISKPVDYWYEIELNPVTNPQTIIGYDEDGAKVFKLFPEGSDVLDIEEADIPVVDDDFSETSERPLQNHVITRRFTLLEEKVNNKLTAKDIIPITTAEYEELVALGTWQEDTIYIITDSSGQSEVDTEALETANKAREESAEALSKAEQANSLSNTAVEVAENAMARAEQSATAQTYTVSVPNSIWVEDAVNGGYMCQIAVNGILATDNPIADVILGANLLDNSLVLATWSLITRIVTEDNSITIYANREAPSTAFTLQLKVVR